MEKTQQCNTANPGAAVTKHILPFATVWIPADSEICDQAIEFISSGRCAKVHSDAASRSKNGRFGVHVFQDPILGACVLKEYGIMTHRGLWRRFESWCKLIFCKRNLRALMTLQRLRSAELPVPVPIAAWGNFRHDGRRYLLYRKLEGIPLENNWSTFMHPALNPDQPITNEALLSYMRTLGHIVRQMHLRGFVHEDIQPGNLLVSPSLDGTGEIGIIDVDSAYHPVTLGKRARFTSYVKSLIRFSWCFEDINNPLFAEFTDAYTNGDREFKTAFLKAVSFWRTRYKKDHHISSIMSWMRCPPPKNWGM